MNGQVHQYQKLFLNESMDLSTRWYMYIWQHNFFISVYVSEILVQVSCQNLCPEHLYKFSAYDKNVQMICCSRTNTFFLDKN